MEINYNNPETGNKLTLNTNKSFILVKMDLVKQHFLKTIVLILNLFLMLIM